MFKKKCRGCAEKVDRKFNYCPWCGGGLRGDSGSKDLGMLGDDDMGQVQEDLKLPFGVEKIVGSLVKQLEKQMGGMNMNGAGGLPKNFKIQIGGMPMNRAMQKPANVRKAIMVSEEEAERRSGLKKVEAESRVKRLGDVIIYEIEAPGLAKKEDVVVVELESGLEVRAYARDNCYVKMISMKAEVLGIRVEGDRVSVELRG